MKLDLTLPHDYEVRTDIDLPSGAQSGRMHEYGSSNDKVERNSCLVEVQVPNGDGWIDRFVGDYDEPPAITTVISAADPHRVGVVCAGRGYLVNTRRPEEYETIPCYPICSVRVVPSKQMTLFNDFSDLVAYGPAGLLWKATGLVSDELRVIDVEDEAVLVEGFDAARNGVRRLAVDMRSGRLRA